MIIKVKNYIIYCWFRYLSRKEIKKKAIELVDYENAWVMLTSFLENDKKLFFLNFTVHISILVHIFGIYRDINKRLSIRKYFKEDLVIIMFFS